MSSSQLNSKTNDLVKLLLTIWRYWGLLHMSPVTGLAQLPGHSVVCSYREFQPGRPGWIQETQPKWWNVNLYYSWLSENFVDPCNFIDKAILHTPEVVIHTRPKLYHFGRYLVKAKLFCRKSFNPVTRLECSYGKIFNLATEISVTGPARPLVWTNWYFYKEKSGEGRYRKPSKPGWLGSYEEALKVFPVACCYRWKQIETWKNWIILLSFDAMCSKILKKFIRDSPLG